MLLLLQVISLSGLAFGQFYNGHPLVAANSGAFGLSSPFGSGSGDSETLPISQEELAQLMAQSLASSPTNYNRHPPRHQPVRHQQTENIPTDDFAANYDSGEEGAGESPNQPEEYSGNEGQQEAGEAAPYQQDGHSEGGPDGQEESHYQQPREPQQTYRENSGSYDNSAPNYQHDSEQYQSGQYPDHSSYGPSNTEGEQQESQPVSYDERRGAQYDRSHRGQSYRPQSKSSGYQGESANREYDTPASPQRPRYFHEPSYAAPGSGYSGPGSESHMTYDVRDSPKSKLYRN